MANRFPLILDTTDGNKIKEIPAGDNLDLRNVSIVDAQNIDALGTINAANITINGNRLQPTSFVELTDVPNNYNGFEGYTLRVKEDGSGLEFYELGADGIPIRAATITVSESLIPDTPAGASIGSNANMFDGVYATFFQGSLRGNDGTTVFDPNTNQIPYAVIAGRPLNVSDLSNDEGFIRAEELRAVIPEFIEEGLVTVEVINTGDLQGDVIAEDSTVLVDAANARINTARLTQNGAANGQTIVWNETTEVWEPGIAGDITGFSSNKVDTLTVETGYKITFQDSPGLIEADTLFIDTTTRLDLNEIQIKDSNNIYPETTETGSIGTSTRKFNEGNFVTVNATNITGDISGSSVITDTAKANLGVFGDKTGGNLGYKLHVIGDLGLTDGDLWMNGGSINGANFEDVTGNFRGSFYGDDSTIIIDGLTNSITGNLQFPSAVGTITGTTIQINASNRVEIGEVQSESDIFPNLDESGAIGTVARRYNEGNFVTLRADNFSIDTVTANTIETSNFLLSGTGTGTLESATDLVLQAANRIIAQGGPFKFTTLSQAQTDNIITLNGDTVYNTTENRFQFFQNNNWVSLHKGLFEGDVIGSVYADDSTQLIDAVAGKVISPTVSGDATFEDNLTVQGNLTVTGTTTSVETTNTTITDNVITLNEGEVGAGVTATTAGIEIDRGSESNVTFVYDDSVDKWTLGSETLVAATVEAAFTGVLGGVTPAAITGTTIDGTTITATTGFVGNITGDASGAHTGTFDGEVTGSVFGDDSTILVDGVAGKVTGDVENTEVVTTTVQGRNSAALNIYRGTGGTVSLGDASSGDVSVSDSGINITSTGGVNVNGAVGATVDIGTGGSTGNVTIGKAGNTTTIDGTFNATLTGDVVGDVTGNVTGNVVGSVVGDITGSVFADDSTLIVDAVNGTLSGPLTGDVTGSVYADDSTQLIDSVAGKLVGDYENGTSTIGSTRIVSYDVEALQDLNTLNSYVNGTLRGGATSNIKNLVIGSIPPTDSTGADGDRAGMIAFDSTSIYYCIANWASPGTADIWVKQDWGTTGSW